MSTLSDAHSFKIIFLLILVLAVSFYYQAAHYAVFTVRDHNSGALLFQKILSVDETFKLHYIHSVTNQPVDEVFYVKSTRTLALKEMYYDSFGANLPVGPEQLRDETTTFIKEGDHYKVVYENRAFDVVPLRVGQVVANHTLIFDDGSKLRFLDVASGGAYVEFYVSPLLNLH